MRNHMPYNINKHYYVNMKVVPNGMGWEGFENKAVTEE